MNRRAGGRTALLVLALLAAAAVLRGITWAAALPAWQGPDELAHYAYVERLATGALPPLQPGPTRDSEAVEASLASSAYLRFRFREADRPLSAAAETSLPRERPGLSEQGRGAHGASIYPPSYYALALPFYALPGLDTATARLHSLRLLSALLAGGLVVATFLLVREATGRTGLALAGGALVTLPPMMGQASGIVNPDLLLALALTGLGWALVRQRRRSGPSAWAHVAAWSALAATTKPVGFAAAAGVAGAFLLVPAAARSRRVRASMVATGASAGLVLTALALVGGERVRSPYAFAGRYLWDFYRPRLPALTAETLPAPAWSVWVETGVGMFGWLIVPLPAWAYALGALAAGLGVAASAVGMLRERRHLMFVASCAAAVLGYVVLLHLAELESLLRGRGSLIQGRYLTAVTPLAIAGFLASVAPLAARARSAAVAAQIAIWTLLALVGLDAVLSYFGS